MQDNLQSEPREAKAIELQVGNLLFVDGRPEKLWHINEHVLEYEVEVFKIAFMPDVPVGVFTVPPTIGSHGCKRKPLRRGRMKKLHRGDSYEGVLRQAATLSDCED